MTNINTYKIPFRPYDGEMEYVSPNTISKESIARIKARKIGNSVLGNL